MTYPDIFVDYAQNQRISEASATADQAKSKAERQAHEINSLRRQVERMALANQAIWEMLREIHGVTDKDLFQRMEEIDLRDGRADGKMGAAVLDCAGCGRKTNSTRRHCIFCGASTTGQSEHLFG